jgi:hypothetical protein
MKMVRGRPEARWLPSRHSFALFRLYAYLRLRYAKHETRDVILGIDPYQSNTEAWTVAVWTTLTSAWCIAGTLLASWPIAIALTAAIPLGMLGIQVTLVASGLTFAPLWNAITRMKTPGVKVNSIVTMSAVAALCAWSVRSATWARFAAWQFFAVFALNALAAIVVFLLRAPIARLEAAVGGAASAQ